MRSFEDEMDLSPLTRTQRKLWVLSAMGVLLDGFDFFIIGVALPLIVHQYHLGPAMRGLIAVAAVAGAFVGALVLGPYADRIGRKGMFVFDLIVFVVFAGASALAWSPLALAAFRFMLGIGIGADYPIGVSYISENVPTRMRARLVVGAFAFQAIGSLAGVLVGLAVLKLDPSLSAWRWMLAFGVIPAAIVVALRSGLPESPRWFAQRARYEEASSAASELLERPIVLTPENAPPSRAASTFGSLFSPPLLRRTIFTSVPWFLQDISTYGIGIFTPTVLAALAIGRPSNYVAKDVSGAEGAAAVDALLVVGFLLAIVLVKYVSRVRLQIAGFLGMAAGLVMVAASTAQPSGSPVGTLLVFGGFMTFNAFMNMGPNSTTYLLSGETFPTPVRATGAGFAASCAKFGAVLGTFFFPVLRASIGLPALLGVLAAASVLAAVVTYAFRVDTSASLDDATAGSPAGTIATAASR